MRIQVLSDVHCEFLGEVGTQMFIDDLNPAGVDVLVLAGDIGNAATVLPNLRQFSEKYSKATVLFVAGNHDFYGSSPNAMRKLFRCVESQTPNLRVLDDQVITVGDITFAGASLWFRRTAKVQELEPVWSDFKYIRSANPWIYGKNKASKTFLEEAAPKVDVVITHHLPSVQCITAKHRGSEISDFFCTPIADTLGSLPRIWIYGHTHDPADFEHRGCRFVCNSYAYPFESKTKFRQNLIIELEPRSR